MMFVYLGIIALLIIQGSNGQETCRSTWRTQGICISLNDCEVLLALLMKPRPLPADDLDTLQNSQCGSDGDIPKVCCPPATKQLIPTAMPPTSKETETCRSAWRTQGICISLNDCEVLLALLMKPRPLPADDLDTLQNSQCGSDGDIPKVCCPPATEQLIPTATPPTSRETEKTCLSAWRTKGICISLNDCEVLLALLRKPRPLSADVLDTLQNSQCGSEGEIPKVCCPPATTKPIPTPTPSTSLLEETLIPDVSNHRNLRLLDHDHCGPVTEARIFGGNKTTVLEFPWMVLVAYQRGNRSPEFRCGGTLISKKYVLTAAHCVTGLDTGLQVSGVRVGEHNLATERDCDMEEGVPIFCTEKYQDFQIASIFSHNGYERKTLQNDIALIKIDGEASFVPPSVRPICLPIGPASLLQHDRVVVTGWGTTESGYRSSHLLKARIPLVNNVECARVYKKHNISISYKQLCAGGANRTDSCSGDSGGPLQAPANYIDGLPRYVQYGVVSFGPRNCGIEGFPGVYTCVAYYMDWILNTMTA